MQHLSKKDWDRLLRENRRLFYQSELRRQVIREAAIEEPIYKKDGTLSKRVKIVGYTCNHCKCCILPHEKLDVDHIDPVRSGYSRISQIEIVWSDKDNLQVLCKPCHVQKTKEDKKKW